MKIRTVTVGDVCKFNSETISTTNPPEKILYLDTSSITKNIISGYQSLEFKTTPYPSRAQRKVKRNTIIYSMVRPGLEHFGFLDNPDENLVVSTGFLTIEVIDKDIDPKFLYYALTRKEITAYLHTIAANSVSSYPSVKPNDIGRIRIDIPKDIRVQRKIASILTMLDNKILINSKINSQLHELENSYYSYWFLQYDFPNSKGKPYKSSGGNLKYTEEVGKQIPSDWKVIRLRELIAVQKGGDWGNDIFENNYTRKVYCIRGADINGLNGKEECVPPLRYISEKNAEKILSPYDSIIEISGGSPTQSTGRMAYVTNETLNRFESPLICSNFCKAISLKDKNSFYFFVHLWENLYNNGAFFGFEGKTSGIKNLLFDAFVNSYYVAFPEESVLKQYFQIMDGFQKKKQQILDENQKLSELKSWLYPILMHGHIQLDKIISRELTFNL